MTDNPKPTRAEIMSADPQQLRLWVANYVIELDALVVEPLVMPVFTGDREFLDKGDIFYTNADGVDMRVPDYPNEIGAAWLVHEHVCSLLFSKRRAYFDALQEAVKVRMGFIHGIVWPDAMAHILPIDISRAALIAVTGAE